MVCVPLGSARAQLLGSMLRPLLPATLRVFADLNRTSTSAVQAPSESPNIESGSREPVPLDVLLLPKGRSHRGSCHLPQITEACDKGMHVRSLNQVFDVAVAPGV